MSICHVIIVDDDEAVLASLTTMVSGQGFDVTCFPDPADMLANLPDLPESCLVTDIRMPGMDGLDLISRLKGSRAAGWPVIVISGHVNVPIAVTAMQLGAVTVLEKPFDPDQLVSALMDGATTLSRSVVSEDLAAVRARYQTLTRREREVLGHLVQGSNSKQAALELGLSPRTVDVFRANILRKMHCPNIAALATQVARGLC
ncbi:response regulator [Brevundimonas sp.]|uniref:response regulator transcription factor n=1 Tax=Brevundimonas sp. TaxID=1871086 RepID=UPI00286C2EA3|nr:response regulator [Brevundimonas sp.]